MKSLSLSEDSEDDAGDEAEDDDNNEDSEEENNSVSPNWGPSFSVRREESRK